MRSSSGLLPRTRQTILAAVLAQPDRSWYLADLARRLRVTPSTLQRELANLCRAGVLKRRREGNRVYYQPDADCPYLPELRGLLLKTTGLVAVVRRILRPLEPRIDVAFVYGSVARGEQRSTSDVDLMVIGSVSLRELAPLLKRAERNLGRQVNAVIYSPEEWAKRSRGANPFVAQVIKGEKIFIIGTDHELAAMAE